MLNDPNFGFIIASYLIAAGVLACLLFWIIADYRRQIDLIKKLDKRGARRRSAEENNGHQTSE